MANGVTPDAAAGQWWMLNVNQKGDLMKIRALQRNLIRCAVVSTTLLAFGGSTARADRVYMPINDSNLIQVLDTSKSWTDTQPSIALGADDRGTSVGVSPDGETLYVTAYTGTVNNLFALDANTGEQRAVRPTFGVFPSRLAVSPDGGEVYVVDLAMPYVSRWDTVLGAPLGFISTGLEAQTDIAVSPDGRYLYVVSPVGSKLAVVDLEAKPNPIVTKIDVGTGASQVAISQPDGDGDSFAYVTFPTKGSVAAIRVDEDPSIDHTYEVTGGPTGVSVHPETGRAYVTRVSAKTISILPTPKSEDEQEETIEVDGAPALIEIASDGKDGFVTQADGIFNPEVRPLDVAPESILRNRFLNDGVELLKTPLDIAVHATSGDRTIVTRPAPWGWDPQRGTGHWPDSWDPGDLPQSGFPHR